MCIPEVSVKLSRSQDSSIPPRARRGRELAKGIAGGVIFAWLVAHAASAENRTALVIGNGSYQTSPLANPVNDARDMSAALKRVGFRVETLTNADQKAMKKALIRFRSDLHARGGVGLFFYAGHGVQIDGENYLIPVGAVVTSVDEVDVEGVRMGEVMGRLASARNDLNIVILDACRDNPFATRFRSASRGLAPLRATPAETLVAYATAPDSVAADGDGRNGLFTSKLLEVIEQPGVRLVDTFRKTRSKVKRASGGKQVPWSVSNVSGDPFYFMPSDGRPEVEALAAAPPPVEVARPGEPFSLNDLHQRAAAEDMERAQWMAKRGQMQAALSQAQAFEYRQVSDGLKVQAYQRFLAAYPENDPHSEDDEKWRAQARRRIAALKPRSAFLTVRSNVADDSVAIDGRKVGPTGARVHELSPGHHVVRVEKPGYRAYERSLTLRIGEERRLDARLVTRGEEGMVHVPGGDFWYGCNPKVDRECRDDERPGKLRNIASFWIDEREVTVVAFEACVDAGECSGAGLTMPSWADDEVPATARSCNWAKPGRSRHPINCVDWHQAASYCDWKGARLPSEAEWEKAARGVDGQKYPWGNRSYIRIGRVANVADQTAHARNASMRIVEGYDDGSYDSAEVGSFSSGASPYGALDMIGNVSEWTSDWYYEDPASAEDQDDSDGRAIRGGSWQDASRTARASERDGIEPEYRNDILGFRCAR
jgi:formylglycine-generating enzyme required for sulfatase activity